MMANAHQIEVADLKAAGLNPILSGMGGSGASASSVSNTAGPAGASGFASGAQLGRTMIAELDALKAQAAASRANAAASLAAADETRRRADLELGTRGSVSVIDPKTGQRLGGGRVPGLWSWRPRPMLSTLNSGRPRSVMVMFAMPSRPVCTIRLLCWCLPKRCWRRLVSCRGLVLVSRKEVRSNEAS